MCRDFFIIYVYCVVCAEYLTAKAKCHVRKRGGFQPALTDEEVITMLICGEFFKLHTDKDLYAYFFTHYRHFFPKLRDRSLFVRQSANLWGVMRVMQEQIVKRSGQSEDGIQTIDTCPVPMCAFVRAYWDRCFKTEADYGYCAAKDMYFYGFKLGLRTSSIGMITAYSLLPARSHDLNFLDVLCEGFHGIILADKGFIDEWQQTLQTERHEVIVLTPPRKNMEGAKSFPYKLFGRIRRLIETVGSQMAGRFAIDRIRVHDLWHLQARIIRKVLAHTVGVFMNLLLRRSPLDLDGLFQS